MKLCIKNLVEQNGFTKLGLAKKLDVSRQYIYSLYDGTVKSIKIETLEKLCEIFHCTPNDLFIGLEELSFLNYQTYDKLPDDFISDEEMKMTRDASPKYNHSEYVDNCENNENILNMVYEIIHNEEFKNLIDQHIKKVIENDNNKDDTE